jgi:DNA relaxase NicK
VQEKIRTITKAATISYARAVEHARLMVGKLVNVMMMVAGGDAFQVISELNRDGYPERLKNYADFLPQAFAGGIT